MTRHKRNHQPDHARFRKLNPLFARDGCACSICGGYLDAGIPVPTDEDYVTFDHVIPKSRGGSNHIDNLRLAHRRCNIARGNAGASVRHIAPNMTKDKLRIRKLEQTVENLIQLVRVLNEMDER